MSPNNNSTQEPNLPGLNSFIKRESWSFISTRYQNMGRDNLELIYNSVLLDMVDRTDYETLLKNLQIEDEEQRIAILDDYLSKIVPGVINRIAVDKNQEAQRRMVRSTEGNIRKKGGQTFKSFLQSSGSSTSELGLNPQEVNSSSTYEELLKEIYHSELQKLGNPKATDPDFDFKTRMALEKTQAAQIKILSDIEKNPAFTIVSPQTGELHDFKSALINQRISKLVATGVIQPHGSQERTDLIAAVLSGDLKFFEQFHISGPDAPSVGFIFPTLSVLASDIQKTANGELAITGDPIAEFNSYTDEISTSSDRGRFEAEERGYLGLALSVDLAGQITELKDSSTVTKSEAVDSIETVIGFSQTLANQQSRVSEQELSNIRTEAGITEGEFSLPEGSPELISKGALKDIHVSSDVVSDALGFAIANSKDLSTEDTQTLKNVQSQALAVSGRMGLSFETKAEMEQYLQSIREIKPKELHSYYKNFSRNQIVPEIESRVIFLKNKSSLLHQASLATELAGAALRGRRALIKSVGNAIFNNTIGIIPGVAEVRATIKFLRTLKEEGVLPAFGIRSKLSFMISVSDRLGMEDTAELLRTIRKYRNYYYAINDTIHIIRRRYQNYKENARLALLRKNLKSKSRFYRSKKALALSKRNSNFFLLLRNDVKRTFSNFANRDSIKNFVSKSKALTARGLNGISLTLEKLKSKSSLLFANGINKLENYASSGKLFSGLAGSSASTLKKLSSFLNKATSKISQKSAQLLSRIKLDRLKSLFSKASGLLSKASKSAVSKASQKTAYYLSKLLARKAAILAAKTAAKVALGAATAGIGLFVVTAVELIGIKRAVMITLAIIVSIIGVILLFVYVIFTSIVSTFSSSNSEAERGSNVYYTYGTVSGSAISLTIGSGSLDAKGCSVADSTVDNINKNDFKDLKVTSRNCRVLCNMAKAVAGLQTGTNRCVGKYANCNPNYFNGVFYKYGSSCVCAKNTCNYCNPECPESFNYFACNYLTHAAYYTEGNVVDPDIRPFVKWNDQWPYWYCVGKPVPMGNVYGGETNEQLINKITTDSRCSSIKSITGYSSTEDLLTKYIMIPLKTQDAKRQPLCVSRSNLDPGDVLIWGYSSCEWPLTSTSHIGLILDVTETALITAEANTSKKSFTHQLVPCEGASTYDENGMPVPADDGVQLLAPSICRLFKPALDDPQCPTDGSAFNCPEIAVGTPGFMRD